MNRAMGPIRAEFQAGSTQLARTMLALVCGGVLLSAALGCGGATKAPAVPTTATVQELALNTGDYFYEPSHLTARPGTLRIRITNVSARVHTFNVKNRNGQGDLYKSRDLDGGSTAVAEFTVSEPGAYQLICLRPGHAERGHIGTLTVTAQ